MITSASSFDEDSSAVKVCKPKKGKKGSQGVASSVDEKEAMVTVSYSSAAGSSVSFCYLFTYVSTSEHTQTPKALFGVAA